MSRDYMGKREYAEEFRANTRKRDPSCKGCFTCYLVVPNAQRVCPECGFEFYQKREPKK